MRDNVFRFFLEKATVIDIAKFCEVTGYCLVIEDTQHFRLVKER